MFLIVPWRDTGCPFRREALDYCSSWWSGFGWEWVLADAGGDLFSRADSINAAVAEHDPDVIVACDADLLVPGLETAVAMAAEPGMVVPFNEGRYLSATGAKLVYEGASPWLVEPRWRFFPSAATPLVGGCNVLSRDTFVEVGGWPTGFAGWGHEDVAFAHACEQHAPIRRVEAPMLHLYHPKGGAYTKAAETNRQRTEELCR